MFRIQPLGPLLGIGVLLKADDLPIAQLPHVRELRVYWRSRRLYLASVSPFDDNSLAAVDEALWQAGEVLYVGRDTLKHAFGHSLWPGVWIAVGIKEVLGFSPVDLRGKRPKHCRCVALAESVVDAFHDVNSVPFGSPFQSVERPIVRTSSGYLSPDWWGWDRVIALRCSSGAKAVRWQRPSTAPEESVMM
jgi:hypothetical protein